MTGIAIISLGVATALAHAVFAVYHVRRRALEGGRFDSFGGEYRGRGSSPVSRVWCGAQAKTCFGTARRSGKSLHLRARDLFVLALFAAAVLPAPASAQRCVGTLPAIASTVMLAQGGAGSLDVQIRDAVERSNAARFAGPKIYSWQLLAGVGAYGVAVLARGDTRYLSRASLALTVSLGSVALLKFLGGRDSAYETGSLGRWHGPTWPPQGWPSGHTATVGALLVTAAELYGRGWARAVAWIGTIAIGTSTILHRQHFVSDVTTSLGIVSVVAPLAAGRRCAERRVEIVPMGLGIGVRGAL